MKDAHPDGGADGADYQISNGQAGDEDVDSIVPWKKSYHSHNDQCVS